MEIHLSFMENHILHSMLKTSRNGATWHSVLIEVLEDENPTSSRISTIDHPFPFPLFPRESIEEEENLEPLNLQVAWLHYEPSILGKPKVDEGNVCQVNRLPSSKANKQRIN